MAIIILLPAHTHTKTHESARWWWLRARTTIACGDGRAMRACIGNVVVAVDTRTCEEVFPSFNFRRYAWVARRPFVDNVHVKILVVLVDDTFLFHSWIKRHTHFASVFFSLSILFRSAFYYDYYPFKFIACDSFFIIILISFVVS